MSCWSKKLIPKTDHMAVKSYNQMDALLGTNESFTQRYLEYGILCVIAITGLFCSGFALIDNSQMPMHNFDKTISSFESTPGVNFDQIVKINGNFAKKNPLNFEINLELSPSRYVLDMGDTRRVILTQNEFEVTFDQGGEYLVELKEISRGLITVIASKKIVIK
jgi:hypothetical protein